MTRSCLFSMALGLLMALPVAAAESSLAGNWQLQIVSPQGTRKPTMTLVQNGSEISGTYHGSRGDVPIAGNFTGRQFELTVVLGSGDNTMTVTYRGQVDGDALAGKVDMGHRGEAEFTGARLP